jgi:hypothetical protein
MYALNWAELLPSFSIPKEPSPLVPKWLAPSPSTLDAVFYQTDPISALVSHRDNNFVAPEYLIFSIMNSMNTSADASIQQLYQWLSIPATAAFKAFRSLPSPYFEVFREKVFKSALTAGHEQAVRLMLDLGAHGRQGSLAGVGNQDLIEISSTYYEDFEFTVSRLKADQATLRHISRTATQCQLTTLLGSITSSMTKIRRNSCVSYAECLQLINILLSRGAKPTCFCFCLAGDDTHILDYLAALQPESAQSWLHNGLLAACLNGFCNIRLGSLILPAKKPQSDQSTRSQDHPGFFGRIHGRPRNAQRASMPIHIQFLYNIRHGPRLFEVWR